MGNGWNLRKIIKFNFRSIKITKYKKWGNERNYRYRKRYIIKRRNGWKGNKNI